MNKAERISLASQSARDVIEFYKKGFLDGYSKREGVKPSKTLWRKIKLDCLASFEKQFKKRKIKI